MRPGEARAPGAPPAPDVSVVIPAYNAEAILPDTVRALVGGTFPREKMEIIVIDDGSRDGTGASVADLPVRVIRQENQGPAAARSRGAQEAAGRVIVFTDADCVPEHDFVEKIYQPFAEDPSTDAAMGAYRTRSRTFISRFSQVEFRERYVKMAGAATIDLIATYAAAFRRDLFLEAGGFDPAFPRADNEDVDFSYRLAARGCRMVFCPEAIVYHEHASSLWDYLRTKASRGFWRMKVYRRYPEKAIKDTYTPQTLKLQILLAPALAVLALGAPLFPAAAWGLLVTALLFGLTTLPLTLVALRLDPALAPAVPAYALLRALALGSGVAAALLRGLDLEPRKQPAPAGKGDR